MDDAKLWRRGAVGIVLARPIFVLHGAAERTRQGLTRAREKAIVRRVAVRAPVAFVRAGCGVENDDAVIDVAVGDVDFIGGCVDDHVGRRAEICGVVAPAALALMPDLHQELAGARELQNVCVLLPAGAEPDVVAAVNVNAVLELGPVVAAPRTTPGDTNKPAASNSSTGGAAFQIDRVSFGCSVDGRCVIQT